MALTVICVPYSLVIGPRLAGGVYLGDGCSKRVDEVSKCWSAGGGEREGERKGKREREREREERESKPNHSSALGYRLLCLTHKMIPAHT